MAHARHDDTKDMMGPPPVPRWVGQRRDGSHDDAAFLAGAALAHLHLVFGLADVPQALLRARLALRAAEACVVFSGRTERASDLRDAVHLLRPGDLPGPSGEVYLQWYRAVERPLSIKALHRALPALPSEHIAEWLDRGKGAPIVRAAGVLEAVLTDAPRAEGPALILADAALAQALGWTYLVPLLALGLRRADLRKRDQALHMACYGAVSAVASDTTNLAADLGRRAAHLRDVAPKLRAKQAPAAVEMFLSRDAVAPSALPLPDRSARRLCERLLTLGALRELTGRDTFRLYGV